MLPSLLSLLALPTSPLPPSPRSLPGLIDLLGGPETSPQRYERANALRRSLQQAGEATLSRENTTPLRFVLDFNSLFEESAQPYSTCFRVGDWYRRGFPGPQPPADGKPTCVRDQNEWSVPASEGCWGICEEADIVTAEARQLIMHVTESVAGEVSNLLAVATTTEPIVFSSSGGNPGTRRTMEAKGYQVGERCASDCQTTAFVAVDDSYCNAGVEGDVILSVTKPPRYQGVAGSGSACSVDSLGRPLWLVFAWIERMSDKDLEPCESGLTCFSSEEAVARWRGLVIHEILHSLGFTNSKFQNARDSSGARKNMLDFLPVEDTDGATDYVWHFKSNSRAYVAAQEYFGCYDDAAWNGLPLMGLPDLGRNSHWETRIMRDDVMSYGMQVAVSSITLAAMEDLGYYLANYSAVNCMSWGYKQGCQFVVSRCGIYGEGQSVSVTDDPLIATKCDGDPKWASYQDPYLNQKCEFGVDPCGNSRWGGVFDGTSCDVQCYTGTEVQRTDCTYVPPGEVGSAGYGGRPAPNEYWMQWLWLAVWVLAALIIVGCIRACLCPSAGSVPILATLSVLIGILGLLLMAFSVYIGYFDGFFGAAIFEGLFGKPTIIGSIIAGCLVAGLSLLSLVAMCAHSPGIMLLSYVLQIFALLVEIAAAALMAFYLWSLTDVANSSIQNVNGVGEGRFNGRIGETALAEIEGVACRTYQFCCRDPRLDLVATANATCTVQREGQLDVTTILQDASSPQFCVYISGSDSDLVPPAAVCDALDWVLPGLDRHTCQENFCTHGTEGYLDFIDAIIAWMRRNAMPLGGSLAMIVLIQLIAIVNAYNLRKRYRREIEARRRSSARNKRGSQMSASNRPKYNDGVLMGGRLSAGYARRTRKSQGASSNVAVARC